MRGCGGARGVLTDLEFYEIAVFRPRRHRGARLSRHLPRALLQLRDHGRRQPGGGQDRQRAARLADVADAARLRRASTSLFAATSGLWGVLVTDLIQFVIAMAGSFAAAYFALKQPQVGGMAGLLEQHPIRARSQPAARFRRLVAHAHRARHSAHRAMVVGVVSGRGAGRRQLHRAAHARREDRARRPAGTLFFNVAHYALRPWPWIIVALSSMLVYPDLSDIASTFPYVDPALIGHDMAYSAMLRFLPTGFLGLMVAGCWRRTSPRSRRI